MSDQTYEKDVFSASSNGRPIEVTSTTTPGDLIHAAPSGADDLDEVWLYASNPNAQDETITVSFGGSASSDQVVDTIEGKRRRLIIAGEVLGGASGLEIRCATGANALRITGYVNKITPAI